MSAPVSEPQAPEAPLAVRPLPTGYRQGLISSITVIIGFSLLFARYWTFEAEGEWSPASVVSAVLLVIAIVMEFTALWRSLLPRDDDEPVYLVTLRLFFASVIVLASAVVLSGVISAHILK